MAVYGGCVYLDLLGFKEWVRKDDEAAGRLLRQYSEALQTKIDDRSLQPAGQRDQRVDALCRRQDFDSFEVLLPFSDCLVILFGRGNASLFIVQLASLMFDAYFPTSPSFAYGCNEDPTRPCVKDIVVTREGNVVQSDAQETRPPVLFRGAIALGDAKLVEAVSILPSREGPRPTEALIAYGSAVTAAALLGDTFVRKHEVKGPRILLDSEVHRSLDVESQRLVAPCTDVGSYAGQPLYELLWPAIAFVRGADPRSSVESDIPILLNGARRLRDHYRASEPEKVEPHYRSFIGLLVRSTLCFYNGDQGARDALTRQLAEQCLLSEPWLQDLL